MTSDSPAATEKLTPSSTTFAPKDLWRSSRDELGRLGSPGLRHGRSEEQLRQEEVGRRGSRGFPRRPPASSSGPTPSAPPFVS